MIDYIYPCKEEIILISRFNYNHKRYNRRKHKKRIKNKILKRRKDWDSNEWWKDYNPRNRSNPATFYKYYANRYLRKTKKEFYHRGFSYRKTFDYWWTID
jgi:hypothetical protein